MESNSNVHRLTRDNKDVYLIGTAHVSKESVSLVKEVIESQNPDTVCVELCQSRYQTLMQQDNWKEMDLIKVIKEKKVFLLLSNLILSSFQRRIAQKLEIKPGMEMIQAIESAQAVGAEITLADRDIRTTLSRTWHSINVWTKLKLLVELLFNLESVEEISEEDIEALKQKDMLESVLAEFGENLPQVRNTLIDERDLYLTEKIRTAPGKTIVAVVGAGHVPGIVKNWTQSISLDTLDISPKPGNMSKILKWAIPVAVLVMIISGFFYSGAETGTSMIISWVIANAVFAALGALAAFAHPFTILSAALAAPITSLNPMIAAGWVSGVVEALSRRPKVKDFQQLPDDVLTLKGFWHNKITRVLLVVAFTNIGSVIGTFVAIPLMMKMFS